MRSLTFLPRYDDLACYHKAMSKNVRRLYRQFRPKTYNLTLSVAPDKDHFDGTVVIDGDKVGRPSQRITFHQKDLHISSVTVTRIDKRGKREVPIKRVNTHASFDEVRLHSDELLYPGAYSITIEFSGTITKPMNGIYPCFFAQDGKPQKLLATQFESHSAREAFPCIDEPEAKAVFELTLRTPECRAVISNTPIKKQSKVEATVITTFEPTPRMSSYLLAFVVGDMDYKERTTKDGVIVRTYATPDNVAFTDFALDTAVRTLEFYNEYFNLPYPLAKCDFIALPDFASGAMENWGCITFREQCLLVDPQNTTLSVKQYVAMVVAHELTHQWFGNLVTMRWWNDLWLNESFASWMAYLACNELFPEWNMWAQFITDEQHVAFRVDALENTHPIEVPIHHPDEIHTIFDAISYEKGASVLQMLHDYLGAEDFRNGLRSYLKKHAYSNTTTKDLWGALEVSSRKPVTDFMEQWTTTAGFPIVHAEIADDQLRIKQERFYINPQAPHELENAWPIPLHAKVPLRESILRRTEVTYKLPAESKDQFQLNSNRTGFFRVLYDSQHLSILSSRIRAGQMPVMDRLGLLNDIFEAAKAGYVDTVQALSLLDAYVHEDNPLVWSVIAFNFRSLRIIMDDTQVREMLRPYMSHLASEQMLRLGWDEMTADSHFDKLLRPIVLQVAAWAHDESVTAEGLRRFETMKQSESVSPDIRSVVYGIAVENGDRATFDTLLGFHNSTSSSEERVTLAGALTSFTQPELIDRALSLIASDNVRLQDVGYWLADSFSNYHASVSTWEWMTQHWDWLEQNIGKDISFARMPLYAAKAFGDRTFLEKYEDFFAKVSTPLLSRSIAQGKETITWQAEWKRRDLELLRQFLKKRT